MLVPLVLTLAWALCGSLPLLGRSGYPGSIEPIYVGLAASLLIYVTGWLTPSRERLVPQEIPS
jgi:hypothetical protein